MKTFYEMLSFLEDDMNNQPEVQGNMNKQSPGGQQTPQEEGPQEMEDGLGDESSPGMGDSGEVKHYMFFNNLKVIKERAEAMLSMDQAQVDAMLSDGHDWASDHISTSKDDVEEVYNWLASEMSGDKN